MVWQGYTVLKTIDDVLLLDMDKSSHEDIDFSNEQISLAFDKYCEMLIEGFKSNCIKELISNNSYLGGYCYAKNNLKFNIFYVPIDKVSHRISNIRIKDNKILCTLEILNTLDGKIFLDYIISGASFCLRIQSLFNPESLTLKIGAITWDTGNKTISNVINIIAVSMASKIALP